MLHAVDKDTNPTIYFMDSFPKDTDSFAKIYLIYHFEHDLQVELLK